MFSRVIPTLIKKYSDIKEEEYVKLVNEYGHGLTYSDTCTVIGRNIKIDPKVYNVKIQSWNLHNLDKEDMYNFVETDYKYFSSEFLNDIDEYSSTLYQNARLLQKQKVAWTMPHTFQINHFREEKDFYISYREFKTGDTRHQGKPVKMLKKLPWLRPVDDKLLEGLSEYVKAKYNTTVKISEVEGEDIRHWYHRDTYASTNTGSLRESCMRHHSCQSYFDIYVHNNVKMIIATKDDKLVGRAILWPRAIWNKNYFDNTDAIVDRIYGNDNTVEQIKQYCADNKYVHKHRQSYNDPLDWVHYENSRPVLKTRRCRMNINTDWDKYPYMDTFKFCNDGYLMNESDNYDKELSDTNGYNSNTCYDCGNNINEDDECSVNGDMYCMDCATYIETRDEYVANDNAVYCEYDGCYIHHDDAVCTLNDDYIHEEDAYSSIRDTWVHQDQAILSYVDARHNDIYIDKSCNKTHTMDILDKEYSWSSEMCNEEYKLFIKYVVEQIDVENISKLKQYMLEKDNNHTDINLSINFLYGI